MLADVAEQEEADVADAAMKDEQARGMSMSVLGEEPLLGSDILRSRLCLPSSCRACIPILYRLDRYDALMLAAFWVDLLGDFLKYGPLVLILQYNFHASLGLARLVKGVFLAVAAAVIFVAGRVLEQRPRNAPLMAIVYTKPIEIVSMGPIPVAPPNIVWSLVFVQCLCLCSLHYTTGGYRVFP